MSEICEYSNGSFCDLSGEHCEGTDKSLHCYAEYVKKPEGDRLLDGNMTLRELKTICAKQDKCKLCPVMKGCMACLPSFFTFKEDMHND